jgi:hypothetical protein
MISVKVRNKTEQTEGEGYQWLSRNLNNATYIFLGKKTQLITTFKSWLEPFNNNVNYTIDLIVDIFS